MGLKEIIWQTKLYDFFGKRSYSQGGEDLLALIELSKIKKGVYVDVGAFHPKVFSNTYLFYKRGWSGVCVEPRPGAEELFRRVRGRDVFVPMGVAEKKDIKELYIFEDGAVNTFDENNAKESMDNQRRVWGRKMVEVAPLRDILAGKGIEGRVDLLSVDTEGMDLAVLKSNDWEKYRPRVVIAENLERDWKRAVRGEVYLYLTKLGYGMVAKTQFSMIFVDLISGVK